MLDQDWLVQAHVDKADDTLVLRLSYAFGRVEHIDLSALMADEARWCEIHSAVLTAVRRGECRATRRTRKLLGLPLDPAQSMPRFIAVVSYCLGVCGVGIALSYAVLFSDGEPHLIVLGPIVLSIGLALLYLQVREFRAD